MIFSKSKINKENFKINLKSTLTLARASSNSLIMKSPRQGSRFGVLKCLVHLITPQTLQSIVFATTSDVIPAYSYNLCSLDDKPFLCCNATMTTAQPDANAKLIINPKIELEKSHL